MSLASIRATAYNSQPKTSSRSRQCSNAGKRPLVLQLPTKDVEPITAVLLNCTCGQRSLQLPTKDVEPITRRSRASSRAFLSLQLPTKDVEPITPATHGAKYWHGTYNSQPKTSSRSLGRCLRDPRPVPPYNSQPKTSSRSLVLYVPYNINTLRSGLRAAAVRVRALTAADHDRLTTYINNYSFSKTFLQRER